MHPWSRIMAANERSFGGRLQGETSSYPVSPSRLASTMFAMVHGDALTYEENRIDCPVGSASVYSRLK